ncbi:hypothetical protein N7517_001667 [Penicillium concentricum]|uniref:Zn(2)-C6 fungal-type domain-containing protein n=1 Tax=Penicillium concentricum TaxID=293559 RepID=A0A9W9VL37_9EURO|nr:uncharacterized protein N7517_001667 [Penicillium concentricum]KAJ5383756.1 hypothetical protein N7517_001667 [Penicillium concentricum]
MPGVPSSRACEGCRQQKKKCDELKPKCSRCTRARIPCVNNGARRFKFQYLQVTTSKPEEHPVESSATILVPTTTHKADDSQPRVANTKAKRAHHTSGRKGCDNCRTRKVPCDEVRPACTQCVSTGRRCDSYATTPAIELSKSQNPPIWALQAVASPIPPLPDKNRKELRSFRFFVDVTAPTLGDAFNAIFWKAEIPRACYLDGAIWHAIISLASAHESAVSTIPAGMSTTPDNLHTLMHYNLAVQNLLKSYSPEGWWRVLTLSILFTSICCLENKYNEAQMHFKYGYKLICDISTPEHPDPHGSLPDERAPNWNRLQGRVPIPVSVDSLRSMVEAFELQCRKLDAAKSQ